MIPMQTFLKTTFLSSLLVLQGCVSYSQTLHNDSGQAYQCKSSGFGWLGAPIAAVSQHQCVKQATKKGYV